MHQTLPKVQFEELRRHSLDGVFRSAYLELAPATADARITASFHAVGSHVY